MISGLAVSSFLVPDGLGVETAVRRPNLQPNLFIERLANQDMVIVRCQDHPPRTMNYEMAVKPVGYPETALVCGRDDEGHDEIGWVYLLPEEYEEYEAGKRVFGLWGPDSFSNAAKARVSNEVVEGFEQWVNEEKTSEGSHLQSQSSIDRY